MIKLFIGIWSTLAIETFSIFACLYHDYKTLAITYTVLLVITWVVHDICLIQAMNDYCKKHGR